ncbi:hypothetical protein [Streptomyces tauricus]|uniref:hypothetical protein n=1 Tax=Streptomyces tauricus TaxID=68274 RepID=UPI0034329862
MRQGSLARPERALMARAGRRMPDFGRRVRGEQVWRSVDNPVRFGIIKIRGSGDV